MSDFYFIGIDPGATGGVCMLDADGILRELCSREEATEALRQSEAIRLRAVIEKQQPTYMANRQANAKTSFVLGRNYGWWECWLEINNVPFERVMARQWQSKMLHGYNKNKKDTKEAAFQVAKALHPNDKITKAMADAVCLAHYCLRINTREVVP